jgi:hypothetical protein
LFRLISCVLDDLLGGVGVLLCGEVIDGAGLRCARGIAG